MITRIQGHRTSKLAPARRLTLHHVNSGYLLARLEGSPLQLHRHCSSGKHNVYVRLANEISCSMTNQSINQSINQNRHVLQARLSK